MRFPVQDWQFWATTAIAALAVAWLLRGVVPVPFLAKRHRRKKSQRRVNLTIGGKPADRS
jgi:hypothetical protein